MTTLDTTQPYGQVMGLFGVAYQQGNSFFDAAGNEVDEHGQAVVDAAPPAPPDQPASLRPPSAEAMAAIFGTAGTK